MKKSNKIIVILFFILLFINIKSYAYKDYLNDYIGNPSVKIANINIYDYKKTQEIENIIINNNNNIKNDNDFYFVNGYTGYKKIDNINYKTLNIVYDELLYILNNIDINLDVFRELHIFIYDKTLKNNKIDQLVNGFYTACISGECNNIVNNMIVLSISNDTLLDFNNYIFRSKVRRTILHELGHVINRTFININGDYLNFWEEIYEIYPLLRNIDNNIWVYNKKENFAEDMVVILAKKLNKKPYCYWWKRTNLKFNKKMNLLFNNYMNQI